MHSVVKILSGLMLTACLLVPLTHATTETQRVLWLTDMDPQTPTPVNISSHDINSQTLALFQPQMSASFEFVPKVLDSTRAMKVLEKRKNACIGKTVHNEERARVGLYSEFPQVVFPPIRLYIRADHEQAPVIEDMLKNGQQLSLQQVMDIDPQLTLGVSRGRSYTEPLDNAIAAIADQNQLWSRAVPDQSAGLFEMLMNQRLDMILLTSVSIHRFMQTSLTEQPLLAVPLEEANEYLPGYLLCNKSEQGRLVISSFNEAMREVSQQRSYFDMHMSWVPATERPYFASLYNAAYGTDFSL